MSSSNPFNLPASQQEVADRAKTDVKSNLPGSDPFLKNSFLGAIVTGFAGRIYDFYLQLQVLIQQIFPNTAGSPYVELWGNLKNINLLAATQASGNIAVTGTLAAPVAIGTSLTSSAGNTYLTTAAGNISNYNLTPATVTFAGGVVTVTTSAPHNLATNNNVTVSGASPSDYNGLQTISVVDDTHFTYSIGTSPSSPATGTINVQINYVVLPVKSQGTGSVQNLASGSELVFTTPVGGIDNSAYVLYDQVSGGTDTESDTAYQAQVIYAYQNPVSFFNDSAITQQCKQINGVTRVFVQDITPAVGQVTVYFMRDNDTNPIPTASEVQTVYNQLLLIKPGHVSASDVIVSAPTPVPVNFVFSLISPKTASMEAAITANLQAFFQEGTTVGQNCLAYQYNSIIYRTIDPNSGTPLNGFTLSSPSGDVSISSSQIATLGTVTFS